MPEENGEKVVTEPAGADPQPVSAPDLTCDWLSHHAIGWQLGEQGILEAIIEAIEKDIPEESRWCVEFGAGDGGKLPLTCDWVIRRDGWRGLLMEADKVKADSLSIRVPIGSVVLPEIVGLTPGITIDDHMKRVGCPSSPALMVCDIDGADYHIIANMQATPYVLCVEHLDEHYDKHPRTPWVPALADAGQLLPGGYHLGATSQAFEKTLSGLGYSLVYKNRYNGIYVRSDFVGKVGRKADASIIRLNVGAGEHNAPGYTALDLTTGTDARTLPYADGSVDEVYSSHLLEHFSFYETPLILKEWVRVLKPGGKLRLAVPDAKKMAEAVLSLDSGGGDYRRTEMNMYGAHNDVTNIHHAMFTEGKLRELMQQAGIGSIQPFPAFVRDDCSHDPCSLNLEGVKRWWPKIEKPVCTMILNQPRFAFTGHELRLIDLARKLDFAVQPSMGAFWDRDMSNATALAIERTNPDFLIYSDYDSIFEVEDVQKLLEAINNDPTMAAIGCVQMSRHNDQPLVFEQCVDYKGSVCQVNFQHYGLTIIRRPVYDEMEHPWYWSLPGKDKDGKWDWKAWSQSDGDITFWRRMQHYGFKVCQHNDVCIGHIIQCIKYPRDKGRGVQYVPIENYWRSGKPKDAIFNPDLYRVKATSSLLSGGPGAETPLDPPVPKGP